MNFRPRHLEHARGFTLVELMVAITGGLFVAMVVFALARDGSRFYQREARVSNATLSNLVGFERLRADISRAGFLSTPNVRWDPKLCGDSVGDASWPTGLRSLAALRIHQNAVPPAPNPVLAANNITPDAIVLTGSYASNDQYPIWNVEDTGANYVVYLQWQTGPLARVGYGTSPNQAEILTSLFGPGRALRIQDQSGEIQFATIASVDAGNNQPRIVLSKEPLLRFRQTAGALCGLKGNVTGASVNVVNFVRYDVRSLAKESHFGGQNTNYQALFGGQNPWDAERTELVRVELDTTGAPIQGTEELVAEHAVDLQFGLTVAANILNGTDPSLQTFLPGDALIDGWAGDIVGAASGQNQGPHRVRTVRVRLSVRSEEPDRDGPVITAPAVPNVAPGLYRIGLGANGGAPFARVRTIQADLSLHNQMGVGW